MALPDAIASTSSAAKSQTLQRTALSRPRPGSTTHTKTRPHNRGACRAAADVEFSRRANPDVNGDALLDLLVDLVRRLFRAGLGSGLRARGPRALCAGSSGGACAEEGGG
eukprot:302901-Chlamydomonas_euryale.AAC.2